MSTECNMKVLSVCTSSVSGGAARAAFRIHQGVNALGCNSTMFVKDNGSVKNKVLSLQDFTPNNALYKAYDWTLNKCKNKWQHYLWGRYSQRDKIFMSDLRSTSLHGALQKIDFDVLHLHWINQRFFPLLELQKLNKPIVWTLHDSWPFCGICHYFFECENYKKQCGSCPFLHSGDNGDLSHRIWEKKKKLYEGLDMHIVSPSRWLADCARQSSLLGGFPVSVIPNCLDIDAFRPLEEHEISPRWKSLTKSDKPLLLFGAVNATTDVVKGYKHLLNALEILEQQGRANDFELIVFGADKPLEGMPTSIPIHYVGYVSDTIELVSLYNLASVMVVPSLTEVFGQTASEAMACGTPVVAFRCTGIQDVVCEDGGYLANPFDDADLANGILWCLQHNEETDLSHNARQKVLDSYTPEKVCRQYVDLYQSVMK